MTKWLPSMPQKWSESHRRSGVTQTTSGDTRHVILTHPHNNQPDVEHIGLIGHLSKREMATRDCSRTGSNAPLLRVNR